ncbi:MAG TPA: DUF4188 domain-containing protein [bacterium]|nr:DUF4188 domain-containing protein [bacterium]
MARVFPGRYTAQIEGPFVVFLIGMRVNHFWKVWKWLPVALSMPPLLKALREDPAKGWLHGEAFIGNRGPLLVQYWRSFEDLERFARSPEEPHLEAWQAFNRRVGVRGDVGVWHETYRVEAGAYECIYNNMPVFGLAQAARHLPADAAYETARRRLARKE